MFPFLLMEALGQYPPLWSKMADNQYPPSVSRVASWSQTPWLRRALVWAVVGLVLKWRQG